MQGKPSFLCFFPLKPPQKALPERFFIPFFQLEAAGVSGPGRKEPGWFLRLSKHNCTAGREHAMKNTAQK